MPFIHNLLRYIHEEIGIQTWHTYINFVAVVLKLLRNIQKKLMQVVFMNDVVH